MATYTIMSAAPGRAFQTKTGLEMQEYMVMLKDDRGAMSAASVAVKKNDPAPSGTLNGMIEQTNYGPKFKRDSAGVGVFGKMSPENQAAIIRQNALTNAVAYCTAKATLMGQEDALKYLSGKEIIQVATYFAKFSKGEISVVTESKPVETPPGEPASEINLDDIFPEEEL